MRRKINKGQAMKFPPPANAIQMRITVMRTLPFLILFLPLIFAQIFALHPYPGLDRELY